MSSPYQLRDGASDDSDYILIFNLGAERLKNVYHSDPQNEKILVRIDLHSWPSNSIGIGHREAKTASNRQKVVLSKKGNYGGGIGVSGINRKWSCVLFIIREYWYSYLNIYYATVQRNKKTNTKGRMIRFTLMVYLLLCN